MPWSQRAAHLLLPGLLLSSALAAQTTPPTTVASGSLIATENAHAVTGVRILPQQDGTVWFLIPSNDRIVQLQADGVTFKQWQIRDDNNIGANPVDFQIDGTTVWFIENGESQIDAGYSAFGRLDTTTGALREWVVPGSRPAAFYRAPDGKVWLPQTNGRLQSLDLNTLQVVDYRSAQTFAYSDMVLGPDGALWLTDFGNNRIVRYEAGAATETSWTYFDPNTGLLNPSQIRFDESGTLWISEFSGARVDRFIPTTGLLASYSGFLAPLHFDIYNGRVYVSEAPSSSGRVVALDPAFATGVAAQLTAVTNPVSALVNQLATTIRDTTITPKNFTATASAIAATDLVVTSGGTGIVRTQFPSVNAFGLSADGGGVWVGTDGNLARLSLQTIGSDSDLTVPVAGQAGVAPGPRIRIAITLTNRGTSPISGNALYLFSPGVFPPSVAFTVNPGQTLELSDAFAASSFANSFALGPVRIQVTSGTAADLSARVRTARILDDGSTFGFAISAAPAGSALPAGAARTLFLGARGTAAETAVLGFYSPKGCKATATLVAADGTVRGSIPIALDANVAQEFNPAASAFGVAPEPGDVVRVTVSSGTVEPYVNVLDAVSNDVATSLPVEATSESVIPNLGTLAGVGGTNFVSDLFLSNPDASNAAHVRVSFLALNSAGTPLIAPVTLPPNGSLAITDVLPTLFSISAGQGALGVESDRPVAVSRRVAARTSSGDHGTFAAAYDIARSIPDGGAAIAFGAPQTATRRTHLLLYNHGNAGSVTVIGFDGPGTEVGRRTLSIGSHQAARFDSVFAQFGLFNQSVGRIRLETTSGMRVFAETAEVDASGDLDIFPLIPSP
jgi:streptogramin lyase